MKKVLIRFSLLLFALILILLAATGIFAYGFDIKDYKEDIISGFNEETGLVLEIKGDLGMELDGYLKVVIDSFMLSDSLGILAEAKKVELILPIRWPTGALNVSYAKVYSPIYHFRTAGIIPYSIQSETSHKSSFLIPNIDIDSVIVDSVDVKNGRFKLYNSEDSLKLDVTEIEAHDAYFSMKGFDNILQSFDVLAEAQFEDISAFGLDARDGNCQFTMKDGILFFVANYQRQERSELDLTLDINPDKVHYQVVGISRGEHIRDLFLNGSNEADWVSGTYTGNYDVRFTIGDSMVDLPSLHGGIMIESKNARILGLDMDKMVKHFKKTQQFSFKDLGSVMLLGPWGLAISKGGDYASLAAAAKKDSTSFDYLHGEISLDSGLLAFDDVAFRTAKNRIAIMGKIDPVEMSYQSFSYALIDREGCSIIREEFDGPFENATGDRTSGFEILIGPVTNLFSSTGSVILRNDCERVYAGIVEAPPKKKGLFRKRSKSKKQ